MLRKLHLRLIIKNRETLSKDEFFKDNARKLMITVNTAFLVAIFTLIMVVLDASFGHYSVALFDFSLTCVSIFIIYLIKNGHIKMSKLILSLSCIFVSTINAFQQGPLAGNQYLWFCMIVGIFVLFSIRERKYMVLFITLCFITLAIGHFTNFSLLKLDVLEEEWLEINHSIILFTCLIVCLVLLFSIVNQMNRSYLDVFKAYKIIRHQKRTIDRNNNELNKFVYHASHDLRSPLTSLLGLIEVSKAIDDKNELKEIIQKQEKTILSLDNHVQNILTLARSKQSELILSSINIYDACQNIISQCSLLLTEKEIDITNDISPNLVFETDTIRLQKILSNLINNSIKYSDQTKSTRLIKVSARLLDEGLEMIVEDNGVGVPAKLIPRLTENYYTTDSGSSGLGLSIVQGCLEALGGKLLIESEIKQQTKMTFIIPFNKNRPTA